MKEMTNNSNSTSNNETETVEYSEPVMARLKGTPLKLWKQSETAPKWCIIYAGTKVTAKEFRTAMSARIWVWAHPAQVAIAISVAITKHIMKNE